MKLSFLALCFPLFLLFSCGAVPYDGGPAGVGADEHIQNPFVGIWELQSDTLDSIVVNMDFSSDGTGLRTEMRVDTLYLKTNFRYSYNNQYITIESASYTLNSRYGYAFGKSKDVLILDTTLIYHKLKQ